MLGKYINSDGSINVKQCFDSSHIKRMLYYYRPFYDTGFTQPSKLLSERTGITVHREWNLPNGWPLRDFELLVSCLYKNNSKINDTKIMFLWDVMKGLNPELNELNPRNIQNMTDCLMGVASMFNVEDIKDFIGPKGPYFIRVCNYLYKEKLDIVQSHYKIDISYVPSMKTLDHIISKIKVSA